MSQNKNAGPRAFPKSECAGGCAHEGMTLRDYFATEAMPLAMQRLKHNYTKDMGLFEWSDEDWEHMAEHAYSMADAMLKVRSQS